ncbi:hypothetical protein GBA63_19695 [Rubrobacter tropicus]|uniref:Uncharacterized protein n=1 Tax=Rubrobacter tropicus TaxID=2653851 RepID=A0A6G8QDP2_9ACTN|nr:hypothetical protein [Rubrobacter tropicus]QIN84624.1 hypothetical protein GBA63_19695 [Rubrobacter tropicus]
MAEKKKPAWLTGEPSDDTAVQQQTPRAGSRKGPLAEDDTGQILTADRVHEAVADDEQTRTVPRIPMPEPGANCPGRDAAAPGSNPLGELVGRLRANPMPLVIAAVALFVAVGFLWIVFGGGEDSSSADSGLSEGANGAQGLPADAFVGGPVTDSGVAFEPMRESGREAALTGAGLEWAGSVSEKEDGRGQTVTLDGPTAAQLERGFDLGSSDVETGVYAVAQEDTGEVLHVTTQTLVPQEQEAAADELTLGTVHAFANGKPSGYAFYLDRREAGSDRVVRTYVRPGQSSYRVSYDAPVTQATGEGDRNGAFVPLLVGWRGFEDTRTTRQGG